MASPARVLSVNVGPVREVEWRGEMVSTAIWKAPVSGRVALRGVNLAGDDQADRTVHGGPDKAVYAYAREDYDYWRTSEGLDVEPALFGENLTVEGIDLSASLVGERWRVAVDDARGAQRRCRGAPTAARRLPAEVLAARRGRPIAARSARHLALGA